MRGPAAEMPLAPARSCAALTVPVAVTVAMESVPADERLAAVIAPPEDTLAALSKPVTLAELAIRWPRTVTVFVASAARTTELDCVPIRTTPLRLPVPASKTKSPPAEPLWPDA